MANASVWILVLTQGQYEDRYETILACYTEKSDAEYQVRHMTTEIGRLRGLIDAENIMREAWFLAHPRPDFNAESPNSMDPSPEHQAWVEARNIEGERIIAFLGIETKCKALRVDSFSAEDGHARVSLSEVQLNPLDSAPSANGGIWKDKVGGERKEEW